MRSSQTVGISVHAHATISPLVCKIKSSILKNEIPARAGLVFQTRVSTEGLTIPRAKHSPCHAGVRDPLNWKRKSLLRLTGRRKFFVEVCVQLFN